MKILDLKCEIRQNKRKNNNNKEMNSKCTNYLKQDFKATAPNKKYSVDITYLPTKKGMVYLNVIIDLFGKIPIAYKSSYSCDSKLAEETIEEKPLIAASMFGVTTPCVEQAKAVLEQAGYEVLVFHATGTGGKTMESLIESGFFTGRKAASMPCRDSGEY